MSKQEKEAGKAPAQQDKEKEAGKNSPFRGLSSRLFKFIPGKGQGLARPSVRTAAYCRRERGASWRGPRGRGARSS